MTGTALIALDWGTSSARAYRVDGRGAVIDQRSAALGIQQIRDGGFRAALATLLGDWSAIDAPRIACGMIGSRQGWVEAPYLDCPADLDALASAIAWAPDRELAVVAGVTCRGDDGVPDVMRGEETQILGALGGSRGRALAVLPGTHSKWASFEDGRILDFATYMTGELHAVLLGHSILGRMAETVRPPEDDPGAAFDRGLRLGLGSGGLGHDLFGARTLALAGELASGDVADWLSGLLIGREIRDARTWAANRGCDAGRVCVIGNDALTARYARALAQAGIAAGRAPAGAAVRGLWAIARQARWIEAAGAPS